MDPFTLFLVNLLIGIVFSTVGSLLDQANRPAAETQRSAGVRGTVTAGGDQPLSFIIGRYGTAGHLEYAGTWGAAGGTPNAYYTVVRSVSDLPVRGMPGFFIFGERVTIDWAATPTAQGYPVLEYRVGGVDHVWVEFFDGTQTTADSFLLAKFGSDANRPWLDDMIGRGIAYFRATALVNRELFPGLPDYFAEIDGIELEDPRGDDAQENLVVMIRQILHGISYDGDWVWGLQGLPASRTPAANWEAGMDRCDLPIDLAGGGTEPQFRGGAEISVDQQPIEVIPELLNSCSGRIAEIGGIYKILVGAPAAPVASITDEDWVIDKVQTLEPFPGLESTFNGINATHPEPAEKWAMKDAPALRDELLEAADDDRRLPAEVKFPYVYSGTQVQRLMQAMHLEHRRFGTHAGTLPPEFWEYEVLDAIEWTSARNGYEAKVFLITLMDDLPDVDQFVGLREQDPTDYDWDPETDEQPYDTVPVVIQRPAPQAITGFAVAPYTGEDSAGNPRRPGFRVFGYGAGLVDVQAVWVQARLGGTTGLVIDGRAPYDPTALAPEAAWAGDPLLPNDDYEVRGKLVPFSGRETEWSSWLAVTTPNVKLGASDIEIDLDEIAAEIGQQLVWIGQGVRDAIRNFERLGSIIAEQDLANFNDREVLKRELRKRVGDLEASFIEIIEVALGPGGAIATALSSLYAAMGGNSSEVNVRWEAIAAPAGYDASYAVQARVEGEDFDSQAAFGVDVSSTPGTPSRFWVVADQFIVTDGTNEHIPFVFQSGEAIIESVRFKTLSSIAMADADTPVIFIDGENGTISITVP